ncbi:MAG: hypothetical protein J7539_13525 [Niabella sp.]|nr:hypothetical protein [Niabella sp.]
MPIYVYIISGFIIIYALVFLLYKNRMRKTADAFNNLDLNNEARNAVTYQMDYLDGAYAFIKEQLKTAPIDAFTSARAQHTAADETKDLAKNLVKGIATMGTVRFRTVRTAKYLVLSGDTLHLLDTNKSGNIAAHLIFDRQHLQSSSLQETTKQGGSSFTQQHFGNYRLRTYKLSLYADDQPIVLDLYSSFLTIGPQNQGTVALRVQDMVPQFVVGGNFLNKLGNKYPNLKVTTDLPNI